MSDRNKFSAANIRLFVFGSQDIGTNDFEIVRHASYDEAFEELKNNPKDKVIGLFSEYHTINSFYYNKKDIINAANSGCEMIVSDYIYNGIPLHYYTNYDLRLAWDGPIFIVGLLKNEKYNSNNGNALIRNIYYQYYSKNYLIYHIPKTLFKYDNNNS